MNKKILCLSLVLVVFFSTTRTQAAINFSANFDNGLNANTANGDMTAYTDGAMPSLVSGFGGTGQAIKNTYGTTLKYKSSNLNTTSDRVSFKFQLPFDLNGDQGLGKITQTYSRIDVSSSTGYVYIADYSSDQVIRASIDGSGWERLGSHGTGDGHFNFSWDSDVSVDPNTENLYISDRGSNRIIKTKFDGSGWTAYETVGRTPSQITYDPTTDYLFYWDQESGLIVKEKFGGTSTTTLDFSSLASALTDLAYDPVEDYVYISDLYKIMRVKMDGSNGISFGAQGSGVNQFDMAYSIDFHEGSLYVCDENNNRIVKTQIDGNGWTTVGSAGIGEGKINDATSIAFDSTTGFIYALDSPYRYGGNDLLFRTKIDGTGWASFGSQGIGTIQEADQFFYDHANQDYYFAAHIAQVIRSKKDGSGWKSMGEWNNEAGSNHFLYLTGMDKDPNSNDLYLLDHYTDQIYKTNMDGTVWESFGGFPGNDLSVPRGLSFDSETGYIYVGDMDHHRIVRTKIDGTGWAGFGSYGSGAGQFSSPADVFYDEITQYIYVTDYSNTRLSRFKWDEGVASWQEIDTSSYSNWGGPEFAVNEGTDSVFVRSGASDIVKLNMNGTVENSFSVTGGDWPSGITYPSPVFYDNVDNTLYLSDSYDIYHCTATGEFIEKINATPEKVLFKTSGAKPFELSVSAYNGKFGLSLNKYQLPISLSNSKSMAAGSWHDIQIDFDRSNGTASVRLDNDQIIEQHDLDIHQMLNAGEYFISVQIQTIQTGLFLGRSTIYLLG